MTKFISEKLKAGPDEARKIQKSYFQEYNTTLNGMIKHHKIDADEFLEFVGSDNIIAHNAPFDIGFLNFELQKCSRDILLNLSIDTVILAREKFPGQSVSLDALCKRLSIDNTQREKHSATIDAELLARVYIELNDAREPSLNLAVDVEDNMIDTDFNISLLQERNLGSRVTKEEQQSHDEFVETLGKDAVWKKIRNE